MWLAIMAALKAAKTWGVLLVAAAVAVALGTLFLQRNAARAEAGRYRIEAENARAETARLTAARDALKAALARQNEAVENLRREAEAAERDAEARIAEVNRKYRALQRRMYLSAPGPREMNRWLAETFADWR